MKYRILSGLDTGLFHLLSAKCCMWSGLPKLLYNVWGDFWVHNNKAM